MGVETYPIILELRYVCVDVRIAVVKEEVVDMKLTVSPRVVESNVEYKYTDPVLYNEDTSDEVKAIVLGISVLNVDAYSVLT